ncbi:hypothetical protein M426DRAFT_13644 [Hypoxylon sp. CI-4A]|nr:hypothetical protein M426DRAFT_13644 [Hypoxylon sp. CI-4A]
MAPRRNESGTTVSELNLGSDVEPVNTPVGSTISIPKAMQNMEKWRAKRIRIQKEIDQDYTNRLAAFKKKVDEHYQSEVQKASDLNKQKYERLIAALEKRTACHEKIAETIESLREDSAHIAMLLDAVYAGREGLASQSAKDYNNQPEN